MNNQPPPILGQPPVLPPPIPRNPPRRTRIPAFVKILAVVVVLFAGFFAFRVVQFVTHVREHPSQPTPGERAFHDASNQIIANKGASAFGNNEEAIVLARRYSRNLKTLREAFFTEGKKNAFSISKGEFLTYCRLNDDSCVFLVHVPELRRFTQDARDSLAELAWINAQTVIHEAGKPPPKTVAVGLKGTVLYESILVGDFVPDLDSEDDGIRQRNSGIRNLKLLYPFFASEEDLTETSTEHSQTVTD